MKHTFRGFKNKILSTLYLGTVLTDCVHSSIYFYGFFRLFCLRRYSHSTVLLNMFTLTDIYFILWTGTYKTGTSYYNQKHILGNSIIIKSAVQYCSYNIHYYNIYDWFKRMYKFLYIQMSFYFKHVKFKLIQIKIKSWYKSHELVHTQRKIQYNK